MTDKTYTIKDMIGYAASGEAAEFQAAFDNIASIRAAELVNAARADVAQSYINPVETEDEEDEPGTEEESA